MSYGAQKSFADTARGRPNSPATPPPPPKKKKFRPLLKLGGGGALEIVIREGTGSHLASTLLKCSVHVLNVVANCEAQIYERVWCMVGHMLEHIFVENVCSCEDLRLIFRRHIRLGHWSPAPPLPRRSCLRNSGRQTFCASAPQNLSNPSPSWKPRGAESTAFAR